VSTGKGCGADVCLFFLQAAAFFLQSNRQRFSCCRDSIPPGSLSDLYVSPPDRRKQVLPGLIGPIFCRGHEKIVACGFVASFGRHPVAVVLPRLTRVFVALSSPHFLPRLAGALRKASPASYRPIACARIDVSENSELSTRYFPPCSFC